MNGTQTRIYTRPKYNIIYRCTVRHSLVSIPWLCHYWVVYSLPILALKSDKYTKERYGIAYAVEFYTIYSSILLHVIANALILRYGNLVEYTFCSLICCILRLYWWFCSFENILFVYAYHPCAAWNCLRYGLVLKWIGNNTIEYIHWAM